MITVNISFPEAVVSNHRGSKIISIILILFLNAGILIFPSDNFKGLNTWQLHSFLENIKNMQDLGAATARIDLPWQLVEPEKNKFSWSRTDAVIDAAQANHIEILFTMRSISTWATKIQAGSTDLYHNASSPKDINDWINFLNAFAGRYKGRGISYEIENEVNMKNFWAGSLEEYIKLLKASYVVIKRNDPNAKVLPSAMGCLVVFNLVSAEEQNKANKRNDDWLLPILSTKAFDVVSVHDYYFPSDINANGWTFTSYLKHIQDLMEESGVGTKPVWVTEAGYVSLSTKAGNRTDKGTPEKQAEWLTLSYTQAIESDVERIFWLFVKDGRGNAGYFDSMGLSDLNGAHRSSWDAMKNLK
jgi:Glycosyl hydrolases family 39